MFLVALFFKNLYNIAMMKNNHVSINIEKDFVASTYLCDGVKSQLHFHNVYEIYYLEKGSRSHLINGINYQATPGTFILIPPGVPHQTSGTAFKRRLIHFNLSLLERLFNKNYIKTMLEPFDNIIYLSSTNSSEYVLGIFNNAEVAYKTDNYEAFSIETAKLLQFIRLQNSTIEQDCTPNLLLKIEKFIQENAHNIISLDELAKNFFISKYYLCHLFKKERNTTVMTYITHIKIQKAAEMLINTNKKSNEICYLMGFNSEYYFSKCFTNVLGISPSKYRSQFRNNINEKSHKS